MSISIIERCVDTAGAGAVDYSTAEKAAETAIAEFARLVQQPEMVGKLEHAMIIGGWCVSDLLAALFREARASGDGE